MKILHTADWHLGHRLHEFPQHDEQFRFLNWLVNFITEQQIDVLLVSGDIFDTGVPSSLSQKLYYDFLIELKSTGCKHVIITGGNHDAPGTLNAPRELLQALSIHVIGKATERIEDEVIFLEVDDEKIIVAAVPFLRDQDIRRAVASESFEQITNRYKLALINHYHGIAEHCKNIQAQGTSIIAMGHLFANGGSTSDSEQTIYVGNLGDIGAGDFPEIFNYIALGHLHRAQKIEGNEHIRYSGSPYHLSFSEVGYSKKIVTFKTNEGKVEQIEEIELPDFRKLYKVKGDIENCIGQLNKISSEPHDLFPWVEVILDTVGHTGTGFEEIHKAAKDLSLEVLKVSIKNERKMAGLEKLVCDARHVKELSPIEVFKLKCAEQEFELKENPEIMDAFHEILQIAKEG